MMKIFFPLLLLSMVSAITCSILPSQSQLTTATSNLTNGVAHAVCEKNPSHLICGTTIPIGHKLVIKHLPPKVLYKPCSIFVATPHCCGQFCQPGNGGTCDLTTGACFCNPAGIPKICNLIMKTKDTPPASLNNNDQAVLDLCQGKCNDNPNGCTKPSAVTDGVAGIVCMCYCDPAGDGPDDTTPTPAIGLPELADPTQS